jgi:cytidylate kinase
MNPLNFPRRFAVAIDGPNGSGKSTAAKKVAGRLGFIYVDTGAMYRAIALYSLRRGADIRDEAVVAGMLREITIQLKPERERLNKTEPPPVFDNVNGTFASEAKKPAAAVIQRLLLNGEDVTDGLRTQEIAEGASVVAVYGKVREKLTALQRAIAEENRVVMDGRDIGSYVLPWAQVKIFLTADFETRLARRLHELRLKNQPHNPETVRREIETRDYRDAHRALQPLICAEDAVYLDTGGLNEDEVADRIIDIVYSKANFQETRKAGAAF